MTSPHQPQDAHGPTPPHAPGTPPEGTATTSAASASAHPAPRASAPLVFQRLSPLTPIVKGWIGLLAVVAIVGRQFLENGGLEHPSGGYSVWLIILAGLGVISIIGGFISWRTTGFAMGPDALHVRKSFISQETETVVYRRIQSVDIVRPLAARLIGVAGLRIDVGGDKAPKLEYLSTARADELRDDLLSRAAVAHRSTSPIGPGEAEESTGTPPRVAQGPAIVRVRCTPRQIILGTITSSEFIITSASIILFGIVPAVIAGQLITLGILLPLGFGIVGIISNRLFKEWNYALATTSDGVVRISRGLTDHVSQTVPTDRVQGFCIGQSLFAKPFGLWRVQFEVFGYHEDEDDEGGSTVLLPAGSWQQAMTAVSTVWPGFDPANVATQPLPRRARWLHPFAYSSYAWGMDDQVVLSRGGVLVHHINVVHQARAQSWTIHQGPLQRRMGLASTRVDITSGPVKLAIDDIEADQARRVTDEMVALGRAARLATWAVIRHQEMPGSSPEPPEVPPVSYQPRAMSGNPPHLPPDQNSPLPKGQDSPQWRPDQNMPLPSDQNSLLPADQNSPLPPDHNFPQLRPGQNMPVQPEQTAPQFAPPPHPGQPSRPEQPPRQQQPSQPPSGQPDSTPPPPVDPWTIRQQHGRPEPDPHRPQQPPTTPSSPDRTR